MVFDNEFTVQADAERVWRALTDADELAACLPGGAFERVGGGQALSGSLSLDAGGRTIDCSATLRPIDVDEDARRASWHGRARVSTSPSFATWMLQSSVTPNGEGTRVTLSLAGRLASTEVTEADVQEHGARLLDDVSQRLAASLETRANAPVAETSLVAATAPAPTSASAIPSHPSAPRRGRLAAGVAAGAAVAASIAIAYRKRSS
jgi:carbon monoxide dehydrogenase subunit G